MLNALRPIVFAILSLSSVGNGTATQYAKAFHAEARGIPHLLLVAIAYHESRLKNGLVSRTNDYGIMQVHVSSTTNPHLRGRERELFNPRRNVREAVRLLRAWRSYHQRHCGKHPDHFWWAHYKWGARVKNNDYASRVKKIWDKLKGK